MIGILKKLQRMRGRSFDELRVRGTQALAAYAERLGWSKLSSVPDDRAFFPLLDARAAGINGSADSLLKHFRTRTSPNFFPAFTDAEGTLAVLQARFGSPAHRSAVIEHADRLIRGRFDLLGFKNLFFGEPIDWHCEPITGKRAPLRHWSRINYLDANTAGDKKIIWELNRHQYFVTLGRAYWRSGDERYAKTFVAHLNAWMDANPPKLGINWASSLEVSFRSISWLWVLYFFRQSPNLDASVFFRALKFLYLHARHLETYLSTYFSPNTHLTGEALGLFYLGMLLPEFREAERWKKVGQSILLEELNRHVKPDGVYFEQSSYYHRYTTDFYTHYLILRRVNGESAGSEVEKKLTALLDHLMYITRPDGTTPFFGDDDGGRLAMLDERAAADFRSPLATGAVLFARPDYKYVAEEATEETLWLTGAEGLRAFDRLEAQPPADQSRGFADGGYYVMRDGWNHQSNYLLIDCGPHGIYNCGHAHSDALAFELAAHGRTLFIDPGTYTYTASAEARDYFRSTAAHNTLTIDQKSSSVPAGAFNWRRRANSVLRHWISHQRFDFFEGEHDGYTHLAAPATHIRSVLFVKGDYWIVRDHAVTSGAHRYDLHFHFAPEVEAAIKKDKRSAVTARGREVNQNSSETQIFLFSNCDGEWRREDGWVSRCYGERTSAPVCVFSAHTEKSPEFVIFLIPPRNTGRSRTSVREVEVNNGRAFEAQSEDGQDVLLIGEGNLIETGRATSDFEWTWMRLAPGTGRLQEAILIGGRRFYLDGQEVVNATERIHHLFLRRVGEELRVETNSGDQNVVIHEQSPAISLTI